MKGIQAFFVLVLQLFYKFENILKLKVKKENIYYLKWGNRQTNSGQILTVGDGFMADRSWVTEEKSWNASAWENISRLQNPISSIHCGEKLMWIKHKKSVNNQLEKKMGK